MGAMGASGGNLNLLVDIDTLDSCETNCSRGSFDMASHHVGKKPCMKEPQYLVWKVLTSRLIPLVQSL